MSKADRRKAYEAALVALATKPDMDDAKRTAEMAAIRATIRRLDLVTAASDVAGEVAEELASADDILSDETRISLMNKLREAINNIHEAG